MKLQVMSDLHFEFHRDGGTSFLNSLPRTDARVLILAGDIIPAASPSEQIAEVFRFFCSRYDEVYFVPGNHEYYGSRAADSHADIKDWHRRLQCPNLFTLTGSSTTVGQSRQRIIGATVWFPEQPVVQSKWKRLMTDFSAIKKFEPWVYEENQRGISFLTERMRKGDIVVTHHLPSYRSVPPQFAASPLNPYFVVDMEELILERQPALWIHGHTHGHCDYRIGDTRVVANPFGYGTERSGFIEDMVIEL